MRSHLFHRGSPVLFLLIIAALLAGCAAPPAPEAAPAATTAPAGEAAAPTTNLTDGCVESYDPAVDYFPEKITLDYASGLVVEYHNNYKRVQVLNPYAGAEEIFNYILLQCGTPAPDNVGDAQVISVPVNTLVSLSTTVLPAMAEMDLLDRLVAVEEFDYVNTPAVRELIGQGALDEVSDGGLLNVEMVLAQDAELALTFAFGSPEYDAHPKLLEAGVPTAITADYMETSPLGRAEWMKFLALFFNAEGRAQDAFAETAAAYNEMATAAQNVEQRPTVVTGIFRGDAWRVSGGNSYFAQFLADAGAAYLWADDDSTGSVPLDFEAVYAQAGDADYWLPNGGTWTTLAQILADDERYAEFAAVQNSTVYNNNKRVNEFGGNDYFEAGSARPDLVLADLLAIFHPDLMPDHELYFYQQLPAE